MVIVVVPVGGVPAGLIPGVTVPPNPLPVLVPVPVPVVPGVVPVPKLVPVPVPLVPGVVFVPKSAPEPVVPGVPVVPNPAPFVPGVVVPGVDTEGGVMTVPLGVLMMTLPVGTATVPGVD